MNSWGFLWHGSYVQMIGYDVNVVETRPIYACMITIHLYYSLQCMLKESE